MQNMEQKKRQLEESHDSLSEELAKLHAQGLCVVNTKQCIVLLSKLFHLDPEKEQLVPLTVISLYV